MPEIKHGMDLIDIDDLRQIFGNTEWLQWLENSYEYQSRPNRVVSDYA